MTDSGAQWETVYKEHGPALLAFLRRRAPRPADAEDLLQETFVRAIRSETAIRNAGSTRSYLFTTARNLLINHLQRDRKPLREAELSAIQGEAELSSAQSTDDAVNLRELDEQVREVMSHMPQAERRAFRSAVLQRESYEDVALRYGWTRDQVKVYVYRARKRMVDELGDYLADPVLGRLR